MAEGTGKNEGNSGGSWWGSWMAAAKEKTEKAFEMVSNDIAEFTTTMQTDTKNVVEKTKETIQQSSDGGSGNVTDKMTASFHHLMEGITKALTVEPEDTAPTKAQVPQPTAGIFDRAKKPQSRTEARLRAIQVDTGTYLSEPSGPPEQYADWFKAFNLDAHKGDISELLVSMVEVRSLYTTLVPSQVSHQDFWGRYFYKIHQLDRDEARKQAMMQRAEQANTKEDSINWDEEWSGDEESGSPEASRQKIKPSSNTDSHTSSPDQKDKTESDLTSGEDINSRLSPDIPEAKQEESKDQQETVKEDKSVADDSIKSQSNAGEEIQSKVKHKSSDETKSLDKTVGSDTVADSNKNLEQEGNVDEASVEKETGKDSASVSSPVSPSKSEETLECDTNKREKIEAKSTPDTCDKADEGIRTKVKGDMVVVGETDRVSPTSESSGTKESSTEDWEKDFDVDITPDDLAAAADLAQKINSTATDYTTISGTEDDWENWE